MKSAMNVKRKERMGLEQFLKLLRKTPRRWEIFRTGMIRFCPTAYSSQCPISSLQNKSTAYYREVAAEIGIAPELVTRIGNAADVDSVKGQLGQLRKRLLLACGLKEQP